MADAGGSHFFQYWFGFDGWVQWVGGGGISRGLFLTLLFFSLLSILSVFIEDLPSFVWGWLIGTMPLWLPVGLVFGAWQAWKSYIQNLWLSKQDAVLLEIKIPRDIMKSPRAMEMFITGLWIGSGEVTYIHRHWIGSTRPFFSFEYASFGGEVHMYIWTWRAYRTIVESNFYAQYPEVEIYEVEDYASQFNYDSNKYSSFCTDHAYAPRSDAYPLKTYVDYELDKDPKEELKVDPLSQIFEVLSSMKKGESIWLQIVLRANLRDWRIKKGTWLQFENRWESLVKEEVEEIRIQSSSTFIDDKGSKRRGYPNPTWRQTEQMKTMERNLGKLPFEVGIRGIYIAEKGVFTSPAFNSLRWIWRPFNNPQYLNQLRPTRGHNIFDYPWQDWNRMRAHHITRNYIDAYRRRSLLTRPYTAPTQTMTPEVIATIFHPPSGTTKAPGITRIPAAKAEAPANIPK